MRRHLAAFLSALVAGSALAAPYPDDKLAARERECRDGNPMACTVLAELYWEGIQVDKDVAKAAIYYNRACAEGPAFLNRNCYKAGAAMVLAQETPETAGEFGDAVAAIGKSCEAGALHDCTVMGFFLMSGRVPTVPKDPRRGIALLTRACDGAVASGCGNLADAFASGNGMPKNARTAASLYAKACGGGYVAACIDAGEMQASGEGGVEKDLVASTRAFKKACDGREVRGCQALAQMYRRDANEARALFKQACGDDAEQCGHFDALIEGIEAVRSLRR